MQLNDSTIMTSSTLRSYELLYKIETLEVQQSIYYIVCFHFSAITEKISSWTLYILSEQYHL